MSKSHQIRRFVENPYAKLAVGVILLISSGQEVITELEEGLQAAHGIFFYALFHILKIVPELLAGLDEVTAVAEEKPRP